MTLTEDQAVAEFVRVVRVSLAALREVTGNPLRGMADLGNLPRRGAARSTSTGQRILWQRHGIGLRLHLAGSPSVDFDFDREAGHVVVSAFSISAFCKELGLGVPVPNETVRFRI